MTAPEPVLPPVAERGTGWERWRARILDDPDWSKIVRWFAPLLVTTLAAVLRLANLNHPNEVAFDETYYVKDAWSLWLLGYEGTWGDGANEALLRGDTSTLSDAGSFVVHPPLGKWLIALGMSPFGPASTGGWRLATAFCGIASVLVVYFIARSLSGSVTVATLAGLLLGIDGLSIVMSRIALLDGILTFFLLLGFLFLVWDRGRSGARHERRRSALPEPLWGPVFWRRPWVVAAGLAFGAASAVKWSGFYALAGAGIYLVVTDALARRRAGVVYWPMDAAVRQGPVSFLLLVPPALLVYLASWSGWFATTGGYDRESADNPLVALWNYHSAIYGFHSGLSTEHPYASPAWQWPLLLRPTSVWVDSSSTDCWGSDHCMASISTLPNPLIWYAGVAAALYLLFRFVRGLATRSPMPTSYAIPLVGLAVTYLPWLMLPNRTIFQFYTVAMMPFLVLALVLALRDLAGPREATLYRRQAGQRTVLAFLVAAVVIAVFFYPLASGMNVPYWFWHIHMWISGWV